MRLSPAFTKEGRLAREAEDKARQHMKEVASQWTFVIERYIEMAKAAGVDRDHRKFAIMRWVHRKKGRGGTLTVEQWKRMLEITGGCYFCGEEDIRYLTFEHLWPKSIGGGFTAENIVPACDRCNNIRGRLFNVSVPLFIAIEWEPYKGGQNEQARLL